MNWQNLPAYRAFEEFLQSIIIDRRSYITVRREKLDFSSAFKEIKLQFVDESDESDETFDNKAQGQFRKAATNTKLVFANLEYLWCMPVSNITGDTKRSYALRWFDEDEVVSGNHFFFTKDDGIANPGMWHGRNKYHEMLSICRIFNHVMNDPKVKSISDAKDRIEALAYDAIYGMLDPKSDFFTKKKCSSYHMLLHLANPDRYEAIVSENHKQRIVSVFAHVIEEEALSEREPQISRIREKLYDTYGVTADAERKRRWFFYLNDVKPLWIDKKSKRAQRAGSSMMEVSEEELAAELEGEPVEHTGFRLRRSRKLVQGAKKRDNFTCAACGFHYQDQIVHVHHLDPLSERKQPEKTELSDLVTLCPNCHYIAHCLLRKSDRYKQQSVLLDGLRKLD